MVRMTAMVDVKAAIGTAMTVAAGSTGWLNIAEPIVTMTVTVLVGGATLWYTVERAMKLRKERTDAGKTSNGSKGGSSGNEGSVADRQR